MKILILSRIPELYSTRRLVEECLRANITVAVENPDCPISSWTAGASCLIPRLGNYRYEAGLHSLQSFLNLHPTVHCLNEPTAFHQARHKRLCLQTLSELPQPSLFSDLRNLKFPFVVKDCLSSQGEGVFLIRNPAEHSACLNKLQNREVLYQEFIAESAGRDVRAFVVGDRLVAAIERRSLDPSVEFRSNLALGGRAHAVELSSEEQTLCLAAVHGLSLDYAGVDFVRSRRGILLLEVNPCPGFEGVEKCTGANVAQEVIRYAESFCSSHS